MERGSVPLLEDDKNNINFINCNHVNLSSNLNNDTSNVLGLHLSLLLNWVDIHKEEENTLLKLSEEKRKKQGIFFTPSELVVLSVTKLKPINLSASFFDPACGTGNLLVEIAKSFEVSSNLEETLVMWNSKIYGLDLESRFVEITKKKLIRLAIDKGSRPSNHSSVNSSMALLENIKVGDFTQEYKSYIGHVENIIMNPPFSAFDAPKALTWSSGKLNAAALFLYYAAQILPPNGTIIGIFPDVIRAGSRYNKLRRYLQGILSLTFEVYGEFQKNVQVDVFILKGIKQTLINAIEKTPISTEILQQKLQDSFDVSVGPVVPHRDKAIGVNAPYIHAKTLPAWGEISEIDERITHQGRKIKTPFVAIRRTSSPKDKNRAIATIVSCKESVAVENHIIVAVPKNCDIESCRKLLKHLSTNAVNEYINSQIRCRHLTVDVIKGIPLGKDINDR